MNIQPNITVKRRLSAPGRRKSFGIELKPMQSHNAPEKDPRKLLVEDDRSVDRPNASILKENQLSRKRNLRAPGRVSEAKTGTSINTKFRAPVRQAKSADRVKGYTCRECERFAELLRSEKVNEFIVQAASRHRYFCAPTATPANLWEPWEIESTPLTLHN